MELSDYYDVDYSPKKCYNCDSSNLEDKVRDQIEYTICEYEVICKDCNTSVSYWAYGNFYPMTEEDFRMLLDERHIPKP